MNIRSQIRILRKFAILAILSLALLYVISDKNVSQPVLAAQCCSDCPVVPGSGVSPFDYCSAQCGAGSGTCYDQCLNGVYYCWAHCVSCGGGGGGAECNSDADCNVVAGYVCVNGFCTF